MIETEITCSDTNEQAKKIQIKKKNIVDTHTYTQPIVQAQFWAGDMLKLKAHKTPHNKIHSTAWLSDS